VIPVAEKCCCKEPVLTSLSPNFKPGLNPAETAMEAFSAIDNANEMQCSSVHRSIRVPSHSRSNLDQHTMQSLARTSAAMQRPIAVYKSPTRCRPRLAAVGQEQQAQAVVDSIQQQLSQQFQQIELPDSQQVHVKPLLQHLRLCYCCL
jgi:isochorismate synthase EntC